MGVAELRLQTPQCLLSSPPYTCIRISTSTCLIHCQEISRRNHIYCDQSRACFRGFTAALTVSSRGSTPYNATAFISPSPTNIVTSAPQASHQGAQSVIPDNARASISASPTNYASSALQVIPQGTE